MYIDLATFTENNPSVYLLLTSGIQAVTTREHLRLKFKWVESKYLTWEKNTDKSNHKPT